MSESEPLAADTAQVTCVGCRQQGAKSDLERFVFHDEIGVMYDMRGGAPGREAWVHPLAGCLRAACWAGFSRAFGQPLEDLDPETFCEDLERGLHQRLREGLLDAARLGEAAVGVSAVEERAAAQSLEVVVLDPDVDGSLAGAIEEWEDELFVFDEIRPGTLREAFGREVEAVGVPPGDRAAEVGRIAEKLICLNADDSAPR